MEYGTKNEDARDVGNRPPDLDDSASPNALGLERWWLKKWDLVQPAVPFRSILALLLGIAIMDRVLDAHR